MKHVPAVLCLAAALMLGQATPPAAAVSSNAISESFLVGGGGTLTLRTDQGKLEVGSRPGNEVTIAITSRMSADEIRDRFEIAMSSRGNDVTVDVKLKDRWRPNGILSFFRGIGNNRGLTFEIMVPRAYNLDLNTSGGSITVDDLAGDVRCRTSGGSVKLSHIDGPVDAGTSGGSVTLLSATGDAELHTSGGSITIGETGGTVVAETSGGSISIDRAAGPVNARTSGGSINITEAAGAIDASTSGGSVTAYISKQPADDCRLSTSGGGITVYVNPSCNLSIDAHSSGGGVSAEGLTVRLGKQKKDSLVADMNGGGPELNLRSSGGGVHIRAK